MTGGSIGLHGLKHINISNRTAWNLAVARRSAIAIALETDVGAGELLKRWPEVTCGGFKFTLGLSYFPTLEHIASLTYVQMQHLCKPATKDSTKTMNEAAGAKRVKIEAAKMHTHVHVVDNKAHPYDNPMTAAPGDHGSMTTMPGDHVSMTATRENYVSDDTVERDALRIRLDGDHVS
jgi:hypothetical protein